MVVRGRPRGAFARDGVHPSQMGHSARALVSLADGFPRNGLRAIRASPAGCLTGLGECIVLLCIDFFAGRDDFRECDRYSA